MLLLRNILKKKGLGNLLLDDKTLIESRRSFVPDNKKANKDIWLFGYGSGNFEIVHKLFSNGLHGIATHAHNDGIELMGEIGVLGILILFFLSIIYFKKLINNIIDGRVFVRFFVISSLLLILFIQSLVDYSLHIPGISILLAVILSVGLVNFRKMNT